MAVAAAEKAVRCLGRGLDMTCDLRLKYWKDAGGCMVARSGETAPAAVPGVGVVRDVPVDVKFDKGDRVRFKSDVLEFNKFKYDQRKVLVKFRRSRGMHADVGAVQPEELGGGEDPVGTVQRVIRPGERLVGSGRVRHKVPRHGRLLHLPLRPPPRPPAARPRQPRPRRCAGLLGPLGHRKVRAQAFFIEKYGTHVIVGLSMGGQDVVYVKQDKSSPLSPSEIKEHLDKLGDQLFTGTCTMPPLRCKSKDKFKIPEAFNVFDAQVAQQRLQGITTLASSKEGVTVLYSKRGGNTLVSSHSEWLLTVPTMPDVINVKLVPITSLIRGVAGTGFLSHAINLYLRYKPPVADQKYFLDFQHHKMWAPVLGELPLGPCSNRQGSSPALHFSLLGSKLYVSSSEVIVPKLPVTGMRLHLEGKKNNRLGVHLQHLSTTPTFIAVRHDKRPAWRGSEMVSDDLYYEPVQWRMFAHVCTAPVKYDPRWCGAGARRAAFIVIGAQLQVKVHNSTNVLHLRLLYSELPGYAVVQSKWERNTARLSGKSSFLSMSLSGSSSGGAQKEGQQTGPQAGVLNINSGVFAGGPPVPVGAQKLLKFVDTSQVTMGPQDSPGYWLVTGARLDVDKGKISLHVKFSLLAPAS